MRVIIIEDEKLAADDLAATVLAVRPDFDIVNVLSSVAEAVAFFNDPPYEPDLIFSDIQLGDGTAFDIFSGMMLRAPVIFCTAYDGYALDAFRANGIGYILKPFTEDAVREVIAKFLLLKGITTGEQDRPVLHPPQAQAAEDGAAVMLIGSADKIIRITPRDIAFIVSNRGTTQIVTPAGEEYTVSKTLDQLEKTIGTSFFRMNRQYLVSKEAVSTVTGLASRKLLVMLKNREDEIIVSKEKKRKFLQWYRI